MDKEQKERVNKRKIAYIYLLHRMFEGSPALMLKIMKFPDVKIEDLEDWNIDYKEAVYKVIEQEDAKGVPMKDPNTDVPSIKSIKEKMLRRVNDIVNETTDPARLATAYKVLSEFEGADDKKEKGVLDAINEIVRPLKPKEKKELTMLERMKTQSNKPVGSISKKEEE